MPVGKHNSLYMFDQMAGEGVPKTAVLLLFVALAGHVPATACAWMSGTPRVLQQQAPKPEWVVVLNRGVTLGGFDCTTTTTTTSSSSSSSSSSPSTVQEAASATGRQPSSSGCKVCGGTPALVTACTQNPKCVGFVIDDKAPGCGHLKGSVGGQVSSATQTLYCNPARGAKCAGQFSFTPRTGMMFTGDYPCGTPDSTSGAPSTLCFVPGSSINVVGAACLRDTQCRAFAYNRADQGGYFKNAGGVASPTSGSDLYQRI